MGRFPAELVKLLGESLALLRQRLSRADRRMTENVRRLRLRLYAAKVSADPENAKWVAQVRQAVNEGVPDSDRLGYDELAELRRAARPRP